MGTQTATETATTVIRRAYRLTLDPRPEQVQKLSQWAGAARFAYNHAIAAKQSSHKLWLQEVAFTTYSPAEPTEEQARKSIRIPTPSANDFNGWLTETRKAHRDAAVKGITVLGRDGRDHEPWIHAVNRYALVGGMRNADAAWKNWVASFRGTRAGRRVGYPQFKKRGVARESFMIAHDRKRPGIRLATTRRLRIPGFGEVRIHDHARALQRKLRKGTVDITSVTVTRRGHRWYASLAVEETIPTPRLSKRKRAAGTVGVDLGVRTFAALSNRELIENPKIKAAQAKKLARLQRRLARSQKGSRNRAELVRKIGRLAHLETRQREGHAHDVTNRLVKTWAVIGIEDLNVRGMTRSARGTIEKPGKNVRAKSGLNRSMLDVAPGQVRRLLTYKSAWSGTQLVVINRWAATSKTCSNRACGAVKAKLSRGAETFKCEHCGLTLDRDINAAINIAALADAARSTNVPGLSTQDREAKNARRAALRKPVTQTVRQRVATKREGPQGSSSLSNERTSHAVSPE
jgi:putative transposase